MFAVLIAVGPGDIEVARTIDLLDSICTHERGVVCTVVLLDDGAEERGFEAAIRSTGAMRVVVLRHMRRLTGVRQLPETTLGPLCVGLLQALSWIAKTLPRDELRFVLKLDTDALVILPFADQIEQLLRAQPEVGLIGACRKTPNGTLRDIGHHAAIMRDLHVPTPSWDRPLSVIEHLAARIGVAGIVNPSTSASRVIHQARRQGYRYGEHCLGGAYALSPSFLQRLLNEGHLDWPSMWMSAPCGEDVMLSMYTHAVGMRMADAVNTGEPFGIRYIGLPWPPHILLERGHSLIHSVKNDSHATEEEIRAFFRARRES